MVSTEAVSHVGAIRRNGRPLTPADELLIPFAGVQVAAFEALVLFPEVFTSPVLTFGEEEGETPLSTTAPLPPPACPLLLLHVPVAKEALLLLLLALGRPRIGSAERM